MLILLEGNQPLKWLDITFGLTEGWWRFTDYDFRNYPLISDSQWQNLLTKNGFNQAITLNPDSDLGQSIIVAQKNKIETKPENHWIILLDDGDLGKNLVSQLEEIKQPYILVTQGEKYQQVSDLESQINPSNPEDFEYLLTEIKDINYSKIINLWNLDLTTTENLNLAKLESSLQISCRATLYLLQSLLKQSRKLPDLYTITQAAVATTKNDRISGLIQSPLWGMGKAIAWEHPELNYISIDLDPEATQEETITQLLAQLKSNSQEKQIAFRNKTGKVARLVRHSPSKSIGRSQENFQLTITEKGNLNNLQIQPIPRRKIAENEVEIKVEATGLNFRDLLNALDMYPGDAGFLGCECAGEVVAVGDKVDNINVGDRVMAIASGSLAKYVTVNQALVALKPPHLTITEAATIPVTFLTAYYTLHQLAKIKTGEKVLIHSGAGGVGQAAIQLAQQVGAEVFVTASPGKWKFLQSLGVKYLFNSRNLDFAPEIIDITQGEGVDIVLNSLGGEFIPQSLSLLKENGRFLEIGKVGVWNQEQVGQVKPNASYFLIDMVELTLQEPNLVQSMLHKLVSHFASQDLQPLPYKTFPLENSIKAFRYMQQGKHIGKIVITGEKEQVRENATYLITGGLGGLGLLIADWLIDRGAKHLVLVSRSQVKGEKIQQIEALETQGAEIVVASGDVSQQEQLVGLIKYIDEDMPPLRGVIHAAGVLADGVLENIDWEQFTIPLAAKIQGAWNLHSLTLEQELDWFVLFSSAASLLGSPGQANHCSANSFLDSLAHYRQSIGLPALSINWGAWAQIGAAAKRQRETGSNFQGVETINPSSGIAIWEQLLRGNTTQVGVVPINWSKFLTKIQDKPFFSEFLTTSPLVRGDRGGLEARGDSNVIGKLKVIPISEHFSLIEDYIRSQVSQVLGFAPTDLDVNKGFFDLGMDSLTSVELKNRLQTGFNLSLPSTLAFDYPTIKALAGYLTKQVNPPQPPWARGELEVDLLSETEVSELLDQKLDDLAALLGEESENHE